MNKRFKCTVCGRSTDLFDRGIYRKIISRTDEKFICIKCLSAKFKIPEIKLREKAAFLRTTCSLFY